MRIRTLLWLAAAIIAFSPATAAAAFEHVVAPGESLSSVAAADGLTVSQLAAANGLAADAQLVAGSALAIPPQSSSGSTGSSSGSTGSSSGSTAASATSTAASATSTDSDGDSDDTGSSVDVAASTSSGAPSGSSYIVQPGDTLSAIAARAGTSVGSLAAANGIDPAGTLLSGAVLSLSGGAQSSQTSQPVAQTGAVSGGPVPTPDRVTSAQIGSVAAANGVPPSLAEAIGWQESGFNNNLVSSTGATGVMQIEPGTWNWIGQNLAGPPPLAPNSAADNIRGGVLLLHSLLSSTGGDPALAAAGYYQGLQSVRAHGLYPATQQYVQNVLALQRQFGGP